MKGEVSVHARIWVHGQDAARILRGRHFATRSAVLISSKAWLNLRNYFSWMWQVIKPNSYLYIKPFTRAIFWGDFIS